MINQNYEKANRIADLVLLRSKGTYLDTDCASDMRINSEAYVPLIDKWIRFGGYRKSKDPDQFERSLQRAMRSWIRSVTGTGSSAAFVLVKEEDKISVLYGTGRGSSNTPFQTDLPECDLIPTQWNASGYAYNAVMTGTIRSDGLADRFAFSDVQDSYVSLVIIPYPDEEVQNKIQDNIRLLGFLKNYISVSRTYGNSGRRSEEISMPLVIQAVELLEAENEYLSENQSQGLVRVAVRYGAKEMADLGVLNSIIHSGFESENAENAMFEPVRSFFLERVCVHWRDCLAVPYVEFMTGETAERHYAVTVQEIGSVASFCRPLRNSYPGFYVRDYSIDESSMEVFPVNRPITLAGTAIGKTFEDDSEMVIPFSSLKDHAFVTGATDSGKTTTVKRILTELHEKGIPFVVVEAAKKEYSSLSSSIPELKVYTPGHDGYMLQMNPLQPEDGVLIENHVHAVVRAMVESMGSEHPIPEALDGLLKLTYQKFGWEYGTMAYTDPAKPFPSFADVAENLDEYIEEHAFYGPEVRQNLTAALRLRMETMYAGALGKLFAKRTGLTAEDMLNSPCVIELSDFSHQSMTFLMNILLFKFQSYLSKRPVSSELKRVIVVEEAHNIFRRTLAEGNADNLNNEYFDKMLSEIRSSGTGLILADQRPGVMSEDVLANTSVKIIHSLVSGEDRKAVGSTCDLTEIQLKKLGELQRGECVISIRGNSGVYHVKVDPANTFSMTNPSCLICNCRYRCQKEQVKNLLERIDPSISEYYLARISVHLYNTEELEKDIRDMLKALRISARKDTKICLVGEILALKETLSEEDRRIIVNTYSNYLNREV